jgi:hypothetical protein
MTNLPEMGASEFHASQIAVAELGDVVLRAAWPEDVREARQLAFEQAVHKVRGAASNIAEQDAVDFSSPMWRWRLFGMPNDPLPDNLQRVQYGSWDPRIEPLTSYNGTKARDYATGMAATYLAPFLRERAANVQQHRPEIEIKAAQVVAAMPVYQLLRSFVPEKAGGAQPLTFPERSGREQEIYSHAIYAAAVAKRSQDRKELKAQEEGLAPRPATIRKPLDRSDLERRPGYYLVRRPLAALNYEESIYPPKDSTGDPWEKVRQLVIKQLNDKYEPDKRDRYSVTWDSEHFYVDLTTYEGTEYNRTEEVRWIASELIDKLHRGISKNELFTPRDECKDLLTRAFSSPPAEEYEHALAKAMATTKNEIVTRIISQDDTLTGWRKGYNSTGSYYDDLIHMQLSQSTGTVVSFEPFDEWAYEHGKEWSRLSTPPVREGVQFWSEHEAEWARQTEIGRVYGTLDQARLVYMGPPLGDIKAEPVISPTVELVFPATQYGDQQPLLVGHNLLAAYEKGPAHYYQYECSAHDPLAAKGEILAPIVPVKQLAVAEMCASIGLNGLAADIRNRADFSIVDLAELLQQHSKYTYTNPAGELEGAVPFEDLSKYVVNGLYHCQCTGANYLSGHLLRTIYADDPSIEIRTVCGSVAEKTRFGYNTIDNAQHAENHIYKDGVLVFVFDATPASPYPVYHMPGRSLVDEDPDAPIESIKTRSKNYADFAPPLGHRLSEHPA